MNILLNAIKTVLAQNGGKIPASATAFRADVVTAVAATSYDGTIGHTQFDALGDTLNHSFSIYVPQSGAWVGEDNSERLGVPRGSVDATLPLLFAS